MPTTCRAAPTSGCVAGRPARRVGRCPRASPRRRGANLVPRRGRPAWATPWVAVAPVLGGRGGRRGGDDRGRGRGGRDGPRGRRDIRRALRRPRMVGVAGSGATSSGWRRSDVPTASACGRSSRTSVLAGSTNDTASWPWPPPTATTRRTASSTSGISGAPCGGRPVLHASGPGARPGSACRPWFAAGHVGWKSWVRCAVLSISSDTDSRTPGAGGRPKQPNRCSIAWRGGVQQPGRALEGARTAAVRPRPGAPTVGRRRRQPGLVAPSASPTSPPPSGSSAGADRALRRAALPLQLQLPRRRLATPRSWPRRRPGSGSRRWPSPTTTASTAWCASPRRPASVGLPTVFGAELTLGAARARRTASPTRRAATCSCWPEGPTGYAAPEPRHQPRPSWRGRRARPGLRPRRAGRGAARATGWCSPAAARGTVPAALVDRRARPRPARELRPARRGLRARPRRGRAVGPRRPARPPATTPWPSWPPRPASRCVATNNVHYATPGRPPAGHRAGRGAGPAQPRRARRLAARGRRRPPALRRRAGPALRPLPRRGRARGRARPGAAPSTCSWWRPTCRRSRARPGTTRWPTCASSSSEGADRRYGAARRRARCRGVGQHRPRAGHHRGARLPRLLPRRVGHRRSSAASSDIFCQGRGSAANSAVCYALGITNVDAVTLGPAVRALPVARARRAARHRRRHRVRPARGGDPVRLRRATAASHTAQVANVITYRPRSAVRDMAKALGFAAGPAGRVVASRSTRWGASRPPRPDRAHDIPAAVLELAARGRGLPPPPRHPLRRHGDLRPAGDRGVPGGVGPHGGPHACCSGTRTTAPPSGW